MDNVITGVDLTENAVMLYKAARQIFSVASINLREWAPNSQEKCIHKAYQANRENIKVLVVKEIKDTTK